MSLALLELSATGVWFVVGAAVVALGVGLYRRATDGRARRVRGEAYAGPWADQLGSRATLVQFSSPICAPCRSAHRVLSALADELDGIAHVEVDVSERLDLADQFNVQRTPTVLVLDAAGLVRQRLVGAPTKAQALEALAGVR